MTNASAQRDVLGGRLGRRTLFKALGAGAMLAATPAQGAERVEKVPTKARIVIAGAGAAGLAAASRLIERLDGATITLIDRRKEHYYQPGFTLVAGGLKPQNYVVTTTAEYLRKEYALIEEQVAEFDP
jgi:sulfide:quinone oxidoreductase